MAALEETIREEVKSYMRGSGFTDRKVTDTPTDDLSTVNRKYVNLNGVTATRPSTSILGQQYFDTTIGKPVWWDGTEFVDATGSSA